LRNRPWLDESIGIRKAREWLKVYTQMSGVDAIDIASIKNARAQRTLRCEREPGCPGKHEETADPKTNTNNNRRKRMGLSRLTATDQPNAL
jgi:hypothetical protein